MNLNTLQTDTERSPYEPRPGSFNDLVNAALGDVFRAGKIPRDF